MLEVLNQVFDSMTNIDTNGIQVQKSEGGAEAWWLTPRTPEVGVRAPLGSPCCVIEQDIFTPPPKLLVIPKKRWLRTNMNEILFTGTLSIKQTKTEKPTY